MKRQPLPVHPTPRVLGIDDWAIRKGMSYGTLLVDLERHQVVDVLKSRSADALRDWLRAHPGVEIITRDRASEYSRTATDAAPQRVVASIDSVGEFGMRDLSPVFLKARKRPFAVPSDHF